MLHTYIPTLNGLAASKNQTGAMGGAYVPTPFVGMYASDAPIRAIAWRRHAKERHVCATQSFDELSRAEGPW